MGSPYPAGRGSSEQVGEPCPFSLCPDAEDRGRREGDGGISCPDILPGREERQPVPCRKDSRIVYLSFIARSSFQPKGDRPMPPPQPPPGEAGSPGFGRLDKPVRLTTRVEQ